MNTADTDWMPMRSLLLVGLLLAGIGLSGCNTVSGAGKDLEAAGDTISDTAEDAKK
ncbi:MAG: entericidin A/B family lipoprotein [Geminicoccaceae bacterium]|nr:entericidin A/B family lipoprotein [Geminicoccaceae bacterium]